MKKLLTFLIVVLMGMTVFAQKSETQTITIQTNGTCEHCKKVMMENVPQWKGVEKCTYDLKTAKITITYQPQKTSPETLRTAISQLGYDADNVKADAEARAKLPSCCTQANKGQGCGGHGSTGGGCGGCGHHH
jgi:copper chaperone CopZ